MGRDPLEEAASEVASRSPPNKPPASERLQALRDLQAQEERVRSLREYESRLSEM